MLKKRKITVKQDVDVKFKIAEALLIFSGLLITSGAFMFPTLLDRFTIPSAYMEVCESFINPDLNQSVEQCKQDVLANILPAIDRWILASDFITNIGLLIGVNGLMLLVYGWAQLHYEINKTIVQRLIGAINALLILSMLIFLII
ncbi:MAG: hypothetical protein ABH864_06155 [archaeon]